MPVVPHRTAAPRIGNGPLVRRVRVGFGRCATVGVVCSGTFVLSVLTPGKRSVAGRTTETAAHRGGGAVDSGKVSGCARSGAQRRKDLVPVVVHAPTLAPRTVTP
ncbi:hypothetical protein GCM10009642_28820 [Nocardiopsis metallicus]